MKDHPTEDPVSNANNRAAARNGEDCTYPCEGPNVTSYGLTKREAFAMAAMQAILTGAVTRGCPSHEWIDQDMAVRCADALLKELAK